MQMNSQRVLTTIAGCFASAWFQLFARGRNYSTTKVKFLRAEHRFHLFLRKLLLYCYGTEKSLIDSLPRVVKVFAITVLEAYLDRCYRRATALILKHAEKRQPQTPTGSGVSIYCGTLGPGGTERQILNSAISLRENDINCEVFCTNLSTKANRFFLNDLRVLDVTVSEITRINWEKELLRDSPSCGLDSDTIELFRQLPRDFYQIADFIAAMSTSKPRIVHCWLDDINVKAGLAAVFLGVEKIIISTRSVSPKNFLLFQPYMKTIYQELLACPNVSIVNNSLAGAEDYADWLKLEDKRIDVIYNGIDFGAFDRLLKEQLRTHYRQQLGIDEEDKVVGGVFRLSEEKRPLLWLQVALQMLKDHGNLKFVVVGDGPLRESMQNEIDAQGHTENILLLGHRNEAQEILSVFDLFFLSSRKEGLPNVLLEAQAMGVPVASFRAGGAPETYEINQSGILLFEEDPESVARELSRRLFDENWLDNASKSGPVFVNERFSIPLMYRALSKIYERVGKLS